MLRVAIPLILGLVMPTFVDLYPDVEIDLMISNRMVGVDKEEFDAGIRYGGTVPHDMFTHQLSPNVQ